MAPMIPDGQLALSPLGTLRFVPAGPDDPMPEAGVLRRIRRAFDRGQGYGLLHLVIEEQDRALPPALSFFRELGRRLMVRLCATPELEARRGELALPPPGEEELEELCAAAPPFPGAEYLSGEVLAACWEALRDALREELDAFSGTVSQYLEKRGSAFSLVGRVCFHLVENKRDPAAPFAFLATYGSRLSERARVQHKPLSRALKELSGAGDREALLALLEPVQRAARQSPLVRELVDSRAVFHPLSWTPGQAYRFLREVPLLEESGVMVRLPDWWHAKRPPRPQVRVTVGSQTRTRLGADALLDFSVALVLDGEPLTAAEQRELLAGREELALVRGRWVEVDRERLGEALERWEAARRVAQEEGIPFAEAMRLLAGARIGPADEAEEAQTRPWSEVVAGPFLAEVLARLREPGDLGEADPGDALCATLRPYQREGVRWLWTLQNLGLGACLADDMGLGKTIQVLAVLLLLRARGQRPSLLVVPASLIANWVAEAERFAPSLRLLTAHPSARPSARLKRLHAREVAAADVVLTSYTTLPRLRRVLEQAYELVVLDEAQAIKNPATTQAKTVKKLKARARVALTGTPVENRLSDLWSIYDFLCPGLLGNAAQFKRFAKGLEGASAGAGDGRRAGSAGSGYAPLRRLVRPYLLRRLKSDRRVIADLPDKTEVLAYCTLSKAQAALYQRQVDELARALKEADGIKRRGLVLAYLMRLKQICNHPSQWLEDGGFAPEESGKFGRVGALCEEIAARQEKVLVFTQFRQLTEPLHAFLAGVFGRPGLVMHGATPMRRRQARVDAFQDAAGPPFFVLSLKVGGTGLNLTAASHVIHFDRWWNPAVENQATDRAYRIGQRRNVLVHKLLCRGTVEERIERVLQEKRALSDELLQGSGEAVLTELGDDELLRMVSLDIGSALGDV